MIVFVVIIIIFGVLTMYGDIRRIAVDEIGEIRYMLRCAKEQQKLVPPDNEKLTKIAKEEVEELEEKYRNHWGRRLAGNRKSVFDFMPTPSEEPDEDKRYRKMQMLLKIGIEKYKCF